MQLTKQDFKDLTTVKKISATRLKFKTITEVCTYSQITPHNMDGRPYKENYNIDDYVDYYYPIYLSDFENK